ncbi:MAG: zinc-dependent metalloprotease [Bacteriovoracaceae bacterium]|nr:zinc-dependent metalloprotease [Bacteriovoracaceae bacterium]
MQKMRLDFINLLFTILIIISGCGQEKPIEYIQGQGKDLKKITITKEFYLKSKNYLTQIKATHANNLIIDNDTDNGFNNFGIVAYQTNSHLLDDVKIRAKEDTVYEIRHILTDDGYLLVQKIGKKEDIPFQERSYAKQLSDGRLAVPVVMYPVEYINVEQVVDHNGEKTNRLMETRVLRPTKASHYRIDLNRRSLFKAVPKVDVFPADFFDGEWFYSPTTVASNFKSREQEGKKLGYDTQLNPVARVKFIKRAGYVIAANTNIDPELLKKDHEIDYGFAVQFPVEWVSYQIQKNKDSLTGHLEEEINDYNSAKLRKKARQYVKVRFLEAKSNVSNSKDRVFEQLTIGKDYFSFTFYYAQEKKKVKFSFKRATHKALKGRNYSKADQSRFGVFSTKSNYVHNYRYYFPKDYQKHVLMSRFYPKNKLIEYRFSKSTPKKYRQLAVDALATWNQALKKAKANITLKMADTKLGDVEVGDIRYNTINIVDNIYGHNSGGWGEIFADLASGEIISASAHLYLNRMREDITNDIRSYVYHRLGRYKNHYYYDHFKLEKDGPETAKFMPVHKNVEQMIINTCDVDQLMSSKAQLAGLTPCLEKLLPKYMLVVLIHEIGHNLGLRHNFAASSDCANFYKLKRGDAQKIATSSVMDYVSPLEVNAAKPGPYDIAALNFSYADVANRFGMDKKYRYCSDEDLGTDDPLCARFDKGETPKKAVDYLINKFRATMITQGSKYDRKYGPIPKLLQDNLATSFFIPLHTFYEKWRVHLNNYIIKKGKKFGKYLSNISKDQYTQILEGMRTDEKYAVYYDQYFLASKKIYEFYRNLIKIPTKHCILKNSDDLSSEQVEVREFEQLRKQIHSDRGITVMDCDDSAAIDYFRDHGKTFVKKVGHNFNDLYSTLDGDSIEEEKPLTLKIDGKKLMLRRVNVMGTAGLRFLAVKMLSDRKSYLSDLGKKRFAPNFLDEPLYRQELLQMSSLRVLKGISAKSLLLQERSDAPAVFYPEFSLCKDHLVNQHAALVTSSFIPQNNNMSNKRIEAYSFYMNNMNSSQNPEDLDGDYLPVKHAGRMYLVKGKDSVAHQFFKTLKKIKFSADFLPFDLASVAELLGEFTLLSEEYLKNTNIGQVKQDMLANVKKLENLDNKLQNIIGPYILERFKGALQLTNNVPPHQHSANSFEVFSSMIAWKSPGQDVYSVFHLKENKQASISAIMSALQGEVIHDYLDQQYEYDEQADILSAIVNRLTRGL